MRHATCLLVAVSMFATSGVKAATSKPKATPAATPAEVTPVPEATSMPAATPVAEDGWEEPVSEVVPAEVIPDAAATPELPAQRATVAAPHSAVYALPSKKANVMTKLVQGTMLQVFAQSDDREFLQVRVTQDDGVIVEGWMRKTEVRSLSRYGFTWERKSK